MSATTHPNRVLSYTGRPVTGDLLGLPALCAFLNAYAVAEGVGLDWNNLRIDELPTYGETAPTDTLDVWSWDATSLLVANDGDDAFCIVPREEMAS